MLAFNLRVASQVGHSAEAGPSCLSPFHIPWGLSFPSKNRGVPHISLVFREMWDATALHVPHSKVGKKVKVRGIPHLAKNKRDMGHPTILGREKDVPEEPLLYGAVENLKSVTLW
jgi:hypothetical protein